MVWMVHLAWSQAVPMSLASSPLAGVPWLDANGRIAGMVAGP